MTSPADDSPAAASTTRELLRQRNFVLYWLSRWTAVLAVQIEAVTLNWQVYEIAREHMDVKPAALMVSLLGLVTFLPVLLLFLPAGETADRRNRRGILIVCYLIEIVVAGFLLFVTWKGLAHIPLLLAIAAAFGAARAFFGPASSAMAPMLVPRHLLPRAIAASSLAWQTGSVVGPLIGGFLVAVSPTVAYSASFGLYIVAAATVFLINANTSPVVQPGSRWALMKEGLAYVWSNKIVFGSISLDLAAVILGGVTMLLPAFAKDVLEVGPHGFGMLRAAPGIGAAIVALWLAARPIHRNAGRAMFAGVAVYGAATLIFALSKWLPLSLAMLALLGAGDMVSVYVRQTLVQLVTPDHMRGRVATVSGLFIGASNELGEFESGVVARFLGVVGAGIFGGVGALLVTGLWTQLFPDLRKADRLA